MVSTRKKKHQNKKLLSKLNETSNDFIIGSDTNADKIENETVEPQTSGLVNSFGKSAVGENSISRNQVTDGIITEEIREEVDNAITDVKKRLHEGNLTAMDNVVIPRAEIAVRLITESSGQGPNSMVQIPDQTYFPGNTEKIPLKSDSGRVDINADLDENDETHFVENFEEGNFPVLRPNCDQQPHAHHSHGMENLSAINLYGQLAILLVMQFILLLFILSCNDFHVPEIFLQQNFQFFSTEF